MMLGAWLLLWGPAWAATTGTTGDTGSPVEAPLTARGGGGCGDGLAFVVFLAPLTLLLLGRRKS